MKVQWRDGDLTIHPNTKDDRRKLESLANFLRSPIDMDKPLTVNMELAPGDVVIWRDYLQTQMVVAHIDDDHSARCTWEEQGQHREGAFPCSELIFIERPSA